MSLLLPLVIAVCAHAGQIDKGGAPYILHPLTVMSFCHTDTAKKAALLHDVLEDTDWTEDDLLYCGVDKDTVRVVKLLTKTGKTEEEYFAGILGDDVAREVKLADLRHNMDLSRIPEPREKDFARVRKYERETTYLLTGNWETEAA